MADNDNNLSELDISKTQMTERLHKGTMHCGSKNHGKF